MNFLKSRFESNPKRIVAFLAVFALLFSFLFIVSPGIAAAVDVPSTSLTVKVNDKEVANYTLADLQQMTQTQQAYTSVDRGPSPVFTAAEGIMLKDLLARLSIETGSIESFNFIATDGYKSTITKEDLLDTPRYYYPNIKTCWGEYPEFKLGAEDGKEEVEPILALKSCQDKSSDGPQFDKMDDTDAIRLCFGQKTIDEQTNNKFAKYVTEIQVIAAQSSELPPLYITGDVAAPVVIKYSELQAMPQLRYVFSTIAHSGSQKCYATEGVKLTDVLARVTFKGNVEKFKFIGIDDADRTVTKQDVDTTRYYFSSPDVKTEVEPILALLSASSPDYAKMNDKNSPRFFYGQTSYEEEAYGNWVKWVKEIEVIAAQSSVSLDAPVEGRVYNPGGQVQILGSAVNLDSVTIIASGPDGAEVFNENIDIVNEVFKTSFILSNTAVTGEYTISVTGSGLASPYVSKFKVEELSSLYITGDVAAPVVIKYSELQAMPQVRYIFSTIDHSGSQKCYATEGVKLSDVLAMVAFKGNVEKFKFIGIDDVERIVTKQDVDTTRYYFSSPDVKTEVEPILALLSASSPDYAKMNSNNSPRFFYGQIAYEEEAAGNWVKWVKEIQVIATPAEPVFTVYDNTATPHSFSMDGLKAMEPKTAAFEQKGKTVNCTGVALADLLTALNIKDNSLMMQIYTKDAADWHVKPVSLADALNPANNYLLTYEIDGQPVEIGPNDLTQLRIYCGTGIFRHVTGVSINTFKEWQPASTTMPVPCDKIWTVTFNQGVSTAQSLSDHIYVSSSAGKRVKCDIEADQKSIRVLAPENGYQPGGSYTLWIQCSLQSATGKMLKQPVKLDFTVASGS